MQGLMNTRWSARWLAFIVWLSVADAFAKGSAKESDACYNEPLTVHCEALRSRMDGVIDVHWKIQNSNSDPWMKFAYCNGSIVCSVTKPLLPNGIKVVNITNGSLTIQRSTKNSTNRQVKFKCVVHYSNSDHSAPEYQVLKMNFTACISAQKSANVNLTQALRNILPWDQVVDIEMYNMNETRFAYCNKTRCMKVNGSLVPVFWNRLQVQHGSLLLTEIKESDDGIKIKVTVHLNTSPDDSKVTKRTIQSVRFYILKIILVNGSQVSEPKTALSTSKPTTRQSRTSPPNLTPHDDGFHTSPKQSAATAHDQDWTVVLMVLAIIIAVGR